MKSTKTGIFVLFLSLITVMVNAQFFIGGSLNLNFNASKTTTNGTTDQGAATTGFGLSPEAGYFVSDNIAFGLGLGYSMNRSNNRNDPATISSSGTFSINPFARYYALELGDLDLFIEGGINLGFGSSRTKTGDVTSDGPKTLNVSFYVMPGFSYDLSDRIALEASFGSLAFSVNRSKQDIGPVTTVNTSSGFNLGFSTRNIQLGFIYRI